MPPLSGFESAELYYSSAFHELSHATAHHTRLNRQIKNAFGSAAYAREELIAEMASAYLCGVAGIAEGVIENKAAYIQKWREVVANDRKAVVVAAGHAQKAAEYITRLDVAEKSQDSEEELGRLLPGIIRECCPQGVPVEVGEAHKAALKAIAKAKGREQ
jgi:antirestriction protein ArdC